jgi:hypothetical protein
MDHQDGRAQLRPSVKAGGFHGKTGDLAFRASTFTRNKRDVWTIATTPFDASLQPSVSAFKASPMIGLSTA